MNARVQNFPLLPHPEIPLEAVDVPLRHEVVESGDEDHGLEDVVEHAVQVQRGEAVAALRDKDKDNLYFF